MSTATLEECSITTAANLAQTSGPGNGLADARAIDPKLYADYAGQVAAIRRSLGVLEIGMDGIILDANETFLAVVGYTLEEVKGKPHNLFVEEAKRNSTGYRQLWEKLNRGEYITGEFRGMGKGGKEVWTQTSYNPIFGADGKPFKVVQFSRDTSVMRQEFADYRGQVAAIRKSQCVAEFNLDGSIRNINKNLLALLGYAEEELIGKHANTLLPPSERNQTNSQEFWAKLNGGQHQLGQFRWSSKGSKELILEASFNPILDLNGKPFKVVLFGTDITPQTKAVETMMADAAMLSDAATHGKMAVRADLDRHQGNYRKIIAGVNQTLDTVVTPLRVAAESASAMASSSEELSAVSQQMSANAGKTAMQANVAAAAADQVSKNIGAVAAAAQEMQSSISEIARNAGESARVSQSAVAVASAATQTVNKLGESSNEIGKMIRVINSIAQQTNLLALNATIEAARAGEAGKGFAVVANEVKELAKQTAKATEEIGGRIAAIQSDTQGAVKAITEIGSIISNVNDLSNSIASAVEEQTVTTNEIGRSVTEVAKGVDEIAQSIGSVAVTAEDTTQGANQTQQASNELSRMANELHTMVAKFTF